MPDRRRSEAAAWPERNGPLRRWCRFTAAIATQPEPPFVRSVNRSTTMPCAGWIAVLMGGEADLRPLPDALLPAGDEGQVKEVMRYAGRRMLFRRPILALLHMLDARRKPGRDDGR